MPVVTSVTIITTVTIISITINTIYNTSCAKTLFMFHMIYNILVCFRYCSSTLFAKMCFSEVEFAQVTLAKIAVATVRITVSQTTVRGRIRQVALDK